VNDKVLYDLMRQIIPELDKIMKDTHSIHLEHRTLFRGTWILSWERVKA